MEKEEQPQLTTYYLKIEQVGTGAVTPAPPSSPRTVLRMMEAVPPTGETSIPRITFLHEGGRRKVGENSPTRSVESPTSPAGSDAMAPEGAELADDQKMAEIAQQMSELEVGAWLDRRSQSTSKCARSGALPAAGRPVAV